MKKKKTCSKCELPKSTAEFPLRKVGWSSKPDSWCYDCRADAEKKRRAEKAAAASA